MPPKTKNNGGMMDKFGNFMQMMKYSRDINYSLGVTHYKGSRLMRSAKILLL